MVDGDTWRQIVEDTAELNYRRIVTNSELPLEHWANFDDKLNGLRMANLEINQ